MSTDKAATHAKFADQHGLPFPLVSDPNAAIAGAFGAARIGGWLPSKRLTFVIGKDGIVKSVIRSELDVDKHVNQALAALTELQESV